MEDEILLFVLTSSLETSINSVFKIHLLFLPKNWEGSAVEINLGFMQFSCIVPSHNNSLGKSTSQKQKKNHFTLAENWLRNATITRPSCETLDQQMKIRDLSRLLSSIKITIYCCSLPPFHSLESVYEINHWKNKK